MTNIRRVHLLCVADPFDDTRLKSRVTMRHRSSSTHYFQQVSCVQFASIEHHLFSVDSVRKTRETRANIPNRGIERTPTLLSHRMLCVDSDMTIFRHALPEYKVTSDSLDGSSPWTTRNLYRTCFHRTMRHRMWFSSLMRSESSHINPFSVRDERVCA
jgi:hypothetical protein